MNVSKVLNSNIEAEEDPVRKLELKKAKNILYKVEGIGTDRTRVLILKELMTLNLIQLTKDKKLVLAGDAIDPSTGMKISAPVDVAPLRGKEAFVYGKGSEEYFLFTDPECPYCKKLESYLPQIANKVKIRVFYFPLESHVNAKDLSLYILSQKTNEKKIAAMFDASENIEKAKSTKYSQGELEKLEKQLDEQIQIGMKLNVQGTPTIFDKDGKNVIWVNLLEKYGIEVK